MSQSNGRAKRSEKGLLTADNCVVALIDHQPQMLFGTSNFDRQSIINCTVALSKASRVFDVPVVLTTVETKSFSANLWPQIKAVRPCTDESGAECGRIYQMVIARGDGRSAPRRSGENTWRRFLRIDAAYLPA
jgi:nicotinamidase-related amidase